MSEEKTEFFRWTRDKHNAFAKLVMKLLDNKVPKTGGTMTAQLEVDLPPATKDLSRPAFSCKARYNATSTGYVWHIAPCSIGPILYFKSGTKNIIGISNSLGIFPASSSLNISLGYWDCPWSNVYAKKLNNGNDIEIPTKGGTLALVSDIEDILRKHNLIPQTN